MNLWRLHFEEKLKETAKQIYSETQTLHQACRYALEGQGKRIRPLLCLAAAEAVRPESWKEAMPAALALEMIHTYSLVHDDLPCMDDDDLRRGRPTTHKAFDTGTALLVGDALLTDAFKILAQAEEQTAQQKVAMLTLLAQAAGGKGMVYGQALDIAWTGRSDYQAEDLDAIHINKTGRLIQAACSLGGIVGGAKDEELQHLETFGSAIGLAFQIIDDLIDETGAIGKTPGKDKALGKLTYRTVMSAERAKKRAGDLTREAKESLRIFGDKAHHLHQLAAMLLERAF